MDIGAALKTLRLSRSLTQEELADRCELSKGFISQVENNLTSPSIATLTDLVECLGSSLRQFFDEIDDEKTVFTRDDMFEKEDQESLRGSITWLVPNAQKNLMEPILVTLGEGGTTPEMPPHEGEEFGYVLSGSLILRIGTQSYPVNEGESFCFHPRREHQILNRGQEKSVFIWVSTPPSF